MLDIKEVLQKKGVDTGFNIKSDVALTANNNSDDKEVIANLSNRESKNKVSILKGFFFF